MRFITLIFLGLIGVSFIGNGGLELIPAVLSTVMNFFERETGSSFVALAITVALLFFSAKTVLNRVFR